MKNNTITMFLLEHNRIHALSFRLYRIENINANLNEIIDQFRDSTT